VFKKTEKLRKPEKKTQKNRTVKNRPVRFGFGFLSLEPEKPNRTKPEPEKTGKKPSQTKKT